MSYYGISLHFAKEITSEVAKDLSNPQPRGSMPWFDSMQAAIKWADSVMGNADNRCVAFLYKCDTLSKDASPVVGVPGCVACGVACDTHERAIALDIDWMYFPPAGFHSESDAYGPNRYLYSPVLTEIDKLIQSEVEAVQLPADYQPRFVDSDTLYVHYGDTQFNIECFSPVYTRSFDMKPEEGFWACAKNAHSQWYDFCQQEKLRNDNPNCRLEFTLQPDSRVMRVETLDDIRYLMHKFPAQLESGMSEANLLLNGLPYKAIDWEAASQELDGVDYSYTNLGNILGAWDCDSLVVFNPDIMQFREIELVPIEEGMSFDQDADLFADIADGDFGDWEYDD